jgi:hypothetical protein
MAETLGSLCDKLTIVKLKEWHTEDVSRLASLAEQAVQLQREIDDFIVAAVAGDVPPERLTFAANKVFKPQGQMFDAVVEGGLGEVFGRLASVNCDLWHEQEKVYEFERVAPQHKDAVVKQLAILNLERTRCIDRIDTLLREAVERQSSSTA